MDANGMGALFCLLFAVYVLQAGIKLGLGGFHEPGAGFFPFFGGMVLLITSGGVLVRCILGKSRTRKSEKEEVGKVNIRLIALACFCLVIYVVIFEWLGFILSTFVMGVILLKVLERKKWWVEVFTAAIISSVAYTIFNLFLESELPKGILPLSF